MSSSAAGLGATLRRRHLPALDGIRALSVFTVIAYHAGAPVPGDLGVSAFFVLSGFLITWLLLQEMEETGRISLRDFYARRTLRIFPAYYVFIIGSLLLDTARGFPWPGELTLSAFTYTVNYYNALHGHPSNGIAHAWSLAVEEQFYLLWPIMFIALSRRGRQGLQIGLCLTIAIVLVWRSYLYVGRGVGTAWVYNAFDSRFDTLSVGCLLAVVASQPWMERLAAAVTRFVWLPVVTGVLVVWLRLGSERLQYTIGMTLIAFLLAILILQLMLLHDRPMWRWLEYPAVRYLGRISYPLYLYHILGLGLARRITGAYPRSVTFALGVVCAVALASASYFIVERPFLSLKRFFSRRPPQQHAAFTSPLLRPVETISR